MKQMYSNDGMVFHKIYILLLSVIYGFSSQCLANELYGCVKQKIAGNSNIFHLSPDGVHMAVNETIGNCNNTIIWKYVDKQWIIKANIPEHGISYINCFNTEGSHLAATSYSKTVQIWCLDNDEWKHKITIDISFQQCTTYFSPDGIHIVTQFDHTAAIWKIINDEAEKQVLIEHTDLSVVRFSPNGKYLLLISSSRFNGNCKIWECDDNEKWVFRISPRDIDKFCTLCFSPDSKYISLTCDDGYCRIINIPDKIKYIGIKKKYNECVYDVCPSPDGKSFAIATHNDWSRLGYTVRILDINTRKTIITSYYESKTFVRFNHTGDRFLTISYNMTRQIWRYVNKKWQKEIDIGSSTPLSCGIRKRGCTHFSSDGTHVVTSTEPSKLEVFALDNEKWQKKASIKFHFRNYVVNARFLPNSYEVAIGTCPQALLIEDRCKEMWRNYVTIKGIASANDVSRVERGITFLMLTKQEIDIKQ